AARPSEEPGAVVPHAGICEGGAGRPASLPQSLLKMRRLSRRHLVHAVWFSTLATFSSCVIPPPYFLTFQENAGMPTINEEGKFEDTPENRKYFITAHADAMRKEANGQFPEKNWKERWRRTIGTIEEGNVNPNWEKAAIRGLRRDFGLPVWDFMY
ncbi:hypothetical protein, partial [Haloferula sp. A504]|uniref:hypothetical protein n=1 Tax=Haloferula sp. A504 TaxID=3373601 RepID=UPI0031C144FB|nr:hypothetical protein [Verrucomicrobiaceae bacterium E54]